MSIEHDHSASGLQFFKDDPKALWRHLSEDHGIEEDAFFGSLDIKDARDIHLSVHYEALAERGRLAARYEDE